MFKIISMLLAVILITAIPFAVLSNEETEQLEEVEIDAGEDVIASDEITEPKEDESEQEPEYEAESADVVRTAATAFNAWDWEGVQKNPINYFLNTNYEREAQYEFLRNWKDPIKTVAGGELKVNDSMQQGTLTTRMDDEALFGSYNKITGAFIGGYLDYDRFPAMMPIKNAVEAGDYKLAKEELLAYYREKFKDIQAIDNKYDTFTHKDLITNELMEYDMVYNGNSGIVPLNIFDIDSKKDWHTIDINNYAKQMTTGDTVTLYLAALKKDGSVAEFDSRTGANPPYMELTISGVTQRLYATDVTYVSPPDSSKAHRIFGNNPNFYVEESISSIGMGRDGNFKTKQTNGVPVDEHTKRGYLKFDVSSIPNDADITNASIKLYGGNVGTSGNTGIMKIAAFRVNLNNWCEGGYTYGTTTLGLSYYRTVNPVRDAKGQITGTETLEVDNHTIFSYYGEGSFGYAFGRTLEPTTTRPSGHPTSGYSSYYRHHEDILRMSFFFAHAPRLYNASAADNDHYASVAIRQWAGFLQERGNLHGTNTSQWNAYGGTHTLDFAVRTRAVVYGMKYLVQSEHMYPEIWCATVKYMYLSGWSLYMQGATWAANNVQTFQGAGLAAVNAYFNEFTDHGKWAAMLRNITTNNIRNLIRSDGSNVEAALGYAAYAIDDMLSWVVPNEEVGITDHESRVLEGGIDKEEGKRMLEGYHYVLRMLGPGYVDNQMGDGSSHLDTFTGVLQRAYNRFNDPYILYAMSGGMRGEKDTVTSVLYSAGRNAVMRTGYNKDDLYVYTDVTPSTSHVHDSKNQIIMFAYGKYMLVDPLYYTYTTNTSAGAIYRVIRSVRMHNTIEVNKRADTQATVRTNSGGTVNNWATNNAFDISNMLTPIDTDANHYRNIVFIKPGFYIVSDYLTPKTSGNHKYWQHWHMMPNNNLTIDEATGTGRTNFKDSANLIVAQAGAGEGSDIIASNPRDGIYSQASGNLTSQMDYLRYEQNSASNVVFDTLLVPEKFGEKLDVTAERLDLKNVTNNGVTAMSLEINNQTQNTSNQGSYYLVHDKAQKAVREFGVYQTDAGFAYAERNKSGKLSRVMLQNGSVVSDIQNKVELIKSTADITDLGIEYSTGIVTLSTSDVGLDLTKLTFYTDRAVSSVKLNGENISFKTSGPYVYFGNSPVIDGEDIEVSAPSVTPSPSNPPVHGGGGGGGGGASAPNNTPVPTSAPDGEKLPDDSSNADNGSDNGTDSPSGNKFVDLDSADWAADYITELVSRNVISGDGEGRFNPNNSVTREEYIKMLLLSLDIEPDGAAEIPFKDVAKGDWAYPYVAAAYRSGIISGMSNDMFGLNQPVSREDMAVITARSLEKLGLNLEPEAEVFGFTDNSDISDYALGSIVRMQECGILNGDGEKRFNPKGNTTRAESAKVIYMLLQKLTD